MKLSSFLVAFTLVILMGACTNAPVKVVEMKRAEVATVDASAIPHAQWQSRFDISAYVKLRGSPNEVVLTPILNHSLSYDGVRTAADISESPHPRLRVPPQYPHELVIRGIPGRVVVAFIVNVEGRVTDAKVLEATDVRFAQAVVESISKWRYIPGTLNASPVASLLVQEFTFERQPD